MNSYHFKNMTGFTWAAITSIPSLSKGVYSRKIYTIISIIHRRSLDKDKITEIFHTLDNRGSLNEN